MVREDNHEIREPYHVAVSRGDSSNMACLIKMQKMLVAKTLLIGVKPTADKETQAALDACQIPTLSNVIQINVLIEADGKVLAVINALANAIPDEISQRENS